MEVRDVYVQNLAVLAFGDILGQLYFEGDSYSFHHTTNNVGSVAA